MLTCPTDESLQSFLSGAVSEAAQESVSRHLENCPTCLERLSRLEAPHDPLVGALRSAESTGPTSFDPAILRLIEESPPILAGQRIGPYEILGKLGEGGMGAVYRVRHEKLGKIFALKLLPTGYLRDPERMQRFEREIKAAGRLEHRHIVRATDAGDHRGSPYLAMELVEGTDLSRLVRRSGPLRPVDACEIVRQAALALEHAHARGLIHRDVKPSNLLLTPDGTVKLLDLGLALASEETPIARVPPSETGLGFDSDSLTATGLALGTRDFMAPEQGEDPHRVDARADVYSLGATLHYLLTGKAPQQPSDAFGGLGTVMWRMLARNPTDRFATAAEVSAALDRWSNGHDLTALAHGTPPRERKRRTYAYTAAAVLLLTGIVVAAAWPSGDPPGEQTSPPDVVQGPPAIEVAPPPRLKPAPPPGRVPMTINEAQESQRSWAAYLGTEIEENGPAGARLALIPPGEFEMAPRYHVTVTKPYFLGITEVTRRQFRAFVSATKYVPTADDSALLRSLGVLAAKTEGDWKNPGFPAADDSPVTHVSQADAQAFVKWLSEQDGKRYRLPTEAEWRWACRAGASTRWPFGDDPKQLINYARFSGSSRGHPERTAMLRPNAWGLFDMLGNVREWSADGLEAYPEGRATDPTIPPKNGMYQLCGGDFNGRADRGEWDAGWRGTTCDCSTAAGRYWYVVTRDGGFRICRDP